MSIPHDISTNESMTYEIHLLPADRRFTTRKGESVLDAALRQGVTLPFGCRNGACGSCKGRVISGEISYPDGLPSVLSQTEADLGWTLFCQARARADLEIQVEEIAAVQDIRIRTLPCRLEKKTQLAHDVMALWLKLPEKERLQFLAGQYVDILLKDGSRRAFSLANAPCRDGLLELHVRHVPGGRFSDSVFGPMKEKAMLRLRGPLGSFYLRGGSDAPIIFVAGGTGFAPIKGMVEQALCENDPRIMYLYWGVRARRDLYMGDLATQWAKDSENIHFVPVLSEPAPEDAWPGRTGFVHEAVLADFPELAAYHVYASGPPVMVYAARDAFFARGLDPANMHSDVFEYAHKTGSKT